MKIRNESMLKNFVLKDEELNMNTFSCNGNYIKNVF